MGDYIKDISTVPPGTGNSVLLRTVDVSQPLDHAQFDQNIWLIAQETLANYNARQGAFVTENTIKDGAVTSSKIADGAITGDHISHSLANGVVPSGSVFPFMGIVPGYPSVFHDSFLLCDGSLVDRAQFASLYTALGDLYGSGDGANTFRLPDLRGRVVVGYQQGGNAPLSPTVVSDPDAQSLGGSGGKDLATLSIDQLPPHQHQYVAANDFNSWDNGENDAPGFNRGSKNRYTGNINSQDTGLFKPEDVAAAISAGGSPTARPGGQPHNNLQPYMVVNYIIKT
jgi:microcystin-dependent protein